MRVRRLPVTSRRASATSVAALHASSAGKSSVTASNAGAAYLYNGTTGALISALTGSSAGDQVGSGNIAASVPDQRKIVAAMRALELLVTIEPAMSQTAKLSHYVLPVKRASRD